jgi:hypothetical protein
MTDNNIKMVLNEELNGVELYFDNKPDQEVINTLKENRFRWSGKKFCWYAKQNENTLALAQSITDEQGIVNTNTTNKSTPTVSTTKEPYFPSYTHVNGSEIYKSSDIELNSNISGYFADINAYIHFYADSAVLIDLTNALKTGKECNRYLISKNVWDDRKSVITELWNIAKIETVKAFYDAIITNSLNIETLKVETGSQKSINTFSPFVEIKPIKTPSKWTIAHVWKAILAGQIYKGVKDGHYTDDYARDNANNFNKGCSLHTTTLANKLIEHPSGWWVSVDKEENGIIQLSVNCHSFDYNTLYYDEKCNLTEAQNRRNQQKKELEEYNNSQLAQVQDIKPEDVEENTLYTVTYLELDDNSKRYHKKTELLTGSQLFWQDEVYIGDETEPTIKYECKHKITAIEVYPITDDKLYQISNFYNRPHFEDDSRIINMGNWETIITGKALKEVLRQGNIFPIIQESQYNFETAITYIKNHITGKMMWCSGVCDTDYQESFKRIMKEANRLNINSTAM